MMEHKRPRDSPSSASNLVSELHQAVTTTQRGRVLQKLSYISEGTLLVKQGIMRALCLQLGFVLNRPIVLEAETDQVGMVCSVIDSLYQNCRENVREESIADIGSELLRIIVKAWKKKRLQSIILSIWRSFSACLEGAKMLIQHPEFLPIMSEVLQNDNNSKATKDETLSILKHISHYVEDHRLSLLEHLGSLLSRLTCLLLTERSLERLSAIFRNLSLTPNVRLAMTEHSGILTALVQLCSKSSQNVKTTRNVMCTIDNLSMETDACMMLLLHGDGMILGVLLHFLSAAEDDVIRRRSARALRLLARDKAVPILLNSTNVMRSLHFSALHDPSFDVRGEASTAYASCASKVNAAMTIHKEVLLALTELATGPAPASVALAFKEQVRHSVNRKAIMENTEFMDAVVGSALQPGASTSAREYVSAALEVLSQDEPLREKLLTESVLNVLVQNAREEGVMSQDAVRALINLASTESTRKRLVTHRGLLQTLIRYSKTCQDSRAKENVKNMMLMLIPQI